jgi:hypothetical protein
MVSEAPRISAVKPRYVHVVVSESIVANTKG